MAKYTCPTNCGYSTNDPKKMEDHKRNLRHDGVARKASKVGMNNQGGKKKGGK